MLDARNPPIISPPEYIISPLRPFEQGVLSGIYDISD